MKHNSKLSKRNISKTDKFDPPKNEKEVVTQENSPKKAEPFKYGPMPTFPHQRVWTRMVLMISVLIIVWITSRDKKETVLAARKEILHNRGQSFDCDDTFRKEINGYPGCAPLNCGRYMSDKVVTASEAESLLKLAKHGLSFGGSDGGASILDLHSGALSYGKKFINIYKLESVETIFSPADLAMYKIVKTKIQHAIAHNFNIDLDRLYLTHPTFFSKLTNKEAKSVHDEYWQLHVDKDTYESFHYTSLLYLSDFGDDFTGGRFIFHDYNKNVTLEPRKGRILMFTSGKENTHLVERVKSGVRYAITVSFTCDARKAISDPGMKRKQ